MRLELGLRVSCPDGELGRLKDVVIDPATKRVTHLVVRGSGKLGPAMLVPIDLVEGGEREVVVRCSIDEASRFEPVQDFAYLRVGELPVDDPNWDVGVERVLATPTYQPGDLTNQAYGLEDSVAIAFDRVPKGEVEIRRSSAVISAEGDVVGHVDGFLVGSGDQITHLVLARGHLWKRRNLKVPLDAIAKVETDSVTLGLSKREIRRLPRIRAGTVSA